ncbi:MAG: oxygen-independent coproporphyrinogen III oxidase [Kordiimonadaceae bacterium]|nr:oxygen-independent coproporphyrinogen III oxidase [Kordiimonadaceae bacterium]MBT6037318.1 oxygen-independent coproporphyrinogen III oxidase [Kordiimonadaceae bacterium]MBT6329266.1 oxygen-independent coproporphyrinogen III oxidase [Kordiimonadaceae bacterium]MBT7582123.1 oxygen-independent coproporphyrinogen III oxidase [Kordiimonadaceae bacterium]
MTNNNTALKTNEVARPKRLPRYTSYPTALEFDVLDGARHDEWLNDLPKDEPVSLYFHIPYCEKLCWFCGCFMAVSNKYGPVTSFLDVLKLEVRALAKKAGTLKVCHIHFGGGSPSILEADDFKSLIDVVRACFDIDECSEFAVEIDPRTVDRDKIFAYAAAGVNRVSLGIQDFNLKTQEAINRVQPLKLIEENMQNFKDSGIDKINFDLIYGLPFQTLETIEDTIKKTLEFKPSRIALFGYAHVPHMKKHQQLIAKHSLPSQQERQAQFELASDILQKNGYKSIGLDHFALEDDPLFTTFDQGKLRRNFQGYTKDGSDTLIGFGPSAISSMPQGYAQNVPSIKTYLEKVTAGNSPVVRGLAVTAQDKMFRDVISTLMCYFAVDPIKIAAVHAISYDFERELSDLNKLIDAGYMVRDENLYSITDEARPFLRAIATIFDQYFDQSSDIIDRCIHESEG